MRTLTGLAAAAAALLAAGTANAQGTIKIGVVLPYSGQFADTATQIDNGIKLYMKQNGETVAGKKIEMIRKDRAASPPTSPSGSRRNRNARQRRHPCRLHAVAKRLGHVGVSGQAKKFMVIMNAATSIITTMSPYSVRTSMTLPPVCSSARDVGLQERHRKAYTMASDLAPGKDAEGAFQEAFKKAGGEIVAPCACRSPIRTSPPSCNAPRT